MSALNLDDCIVAIASGAAPSLVGILRLSGRDARTIVRRVLMDPPPVCDANGVRRVRVCVLDGHELPGDLFEFASPRSYTGQDVAELHTVGSRPVLELLLEELVAAGARRAMPGEFTARAYLAEKLDAQQVTGVLGLLRAGNDHAARQAARLVTGEYGRALEACRQRVLDLLALVEAGIDFVEEDISFISGAAVQERMEQVRAELLALIGAGQQKSRSTLPHVLLAGLPNAGKSTLFNALLGRERAIVSPIQGTTRDVLCEEWECGGIRVMLQDSAGIEQQAGEIVEAGEAARVGAAVRADVVLWVHAADCAWTDAELALLRRCAQGAPVRVVLSKTDLCSCDNGLPGESPVEIEAAMQVCALSGRGLNAVAQVVRDVVQDGVTSAGDARLHGARVTATVEAVQRLAGAGASVGQPELVALELRDLLGQLGVAETAETTETVLGRIFGSFCIGK